MTSRTKTSRQAATHLPRAVPTAMQAAAGRSAVATLQNRVGNRTLAHWLNTGVNAGSHPVQAKYKTGRSDDPHEREADQAAERVMRLAAAGAGNGLADATGAGANGVSQAGAGRGLSPPQRRWYENAFGWNFAGVQLHRGATASAATDRLGAHAYTRGRDIVFGAAVSNPEAPEHRSLLAHELAHVVQQDKAAGVHPPNATGQTIAASLSAAPGGQPQALPRVTAVNTSAAELGVGSGRDITAEAVIAGAPRNPALVWSLNPVIAGVTVVGSGRRVRLRAAQPGGGAAVGGVNFTAQATLAADATDSAVSNPIALIQVVSATYTNAPALANVPSLIPGIAPPNTGEPNRDGIAGNTVTVNAVTAPAGRPITVSFRGGRLGAALAGTVITPGRATGDITLRIEDNATRARLDETIPPAAGPGATMATLVINAAPTRVNRLTGAGAAGPYGVQNRIGFAVTDNRHPPLTRVVGELITHLRDDFNIPPPNGAFNPAPVLGLAVPANAWVDQLVTPPLVANVADGLPAIDVNRFVGPGVPGLPRRLIYRQGFVHFAWQGAGAVFSNEFDNGSHRRSLIRQGAGFRFTTEHIFPGARAPVRNEPYAGPPLIIFSAVTAVPTAPGATALAADGAATANLTVVSNVPGRSANWTVLTGDVAVTAGNPAVLPAAATLTAGVRTGSFRLRAADTIFPNRRADGRVRVEAVRLRNMRPVLRRVPPGTNATVVNVSAQPGGRTLNWVVDGAAAAAGVVVNPPNTGPGPAAMAVTVTRPPAFNGTVTVTATDSVLGAVQATTSIRFQ